ncbi:MAG: MFS transporter [Ilumatobacteraceae bacterium]
MEPGGRIVTRRWPDDPTHRSLLECPRDDLLLEQPEAMTRPDPPPDSARGHALVFTQAQGPFTAYRRTVVPDGDELVESTEYGVTIPWFGWLFRWPVRGVLARRISAQGWWAPPDRLDPTQLLVLGLLAAASMSAAFVNTLFTQTVSFAADDFGVDNTGVGIAGAFVRVGIVIALPAAVIADRIGRRRVIVWVAWLGPLLSVLGAIAPTFGVLVLTQTLARPMGIALAFLVGVVAAEEMPRNSRAYAVSILAMAAGFGAGVAVIALALADIGPSGWRLVYVVSLVWCLVALDLARRLPETRRFTAAHITRATHRPRMNRRRLGLLAAVAFIGNIFIAPASFFQNRYLTDVQGFSGGMIGVFSIAVGTPAGIGLIVGGRIADTSGRRRLIAVALPVSTIAIVGAFMVSGVSLWILSLVGGVIASAAYPALAVYRVELFPTGNRSRAAGLVTAASLIGGVIGLISMGALLDADWSFGAVLALLGISQFIVTVLVVQAYPETAHQELEALNPEDVEFTPAPDR